MQTARRDKAFRIALFGLAIACGLIFFATKFRVVNDWLVAGAGKYGDLYAELGVLDFKVELGPHTLPRYTGGLHTTADSAKIFLMGDSFLRTGGDRHPGMDEITIELGQPMRWIREGDPQRFPLTCLRKENVKPSAERRILILECVERNIMYFYRNFKVDVVDEQGDEAIPEELIDLRNKFLDIRDVWFTGVEQRYQYLLSASVVTAGVMESINTFKFRQLGMMPMRFQVYSTNPPMVFSYHETNTASPLSFFHQHTDEDVETIVRNWVELSRTLDHELNIELWMVLVPNKITVYHKLATDVEYDNFIPRLQEGFETEGVKYVDVFDPLMSADKQVFYTTDSHWNQNGLGIAVKTIGETLRAAGTIPPKTS